jgi:transposase
MIQRAGEVVIRMLENVKQVTIGPLIQETIAEGSVIYTDEYDIHTRLSEWCYDHRTVCHAQGSTPGMTTGMCSARRT